MDDFKRRLDAAEGYLALGMPLDAWAETEAIEPERRADSMVCILRVHILNRLERWEAAATLGHGALKQWPDIGDLYLSTAYAVRRWSSLAEARAVLLLGESVLSKVAVWHFNLACYDCQLGDMASAKTRLFTAIALDSKFRAVALEDDDLEPLWSSL